MVSPHQGNYRPGRRRELDPRIDPRPPGAPAPALRDHWVGPGGLEPPTYGLKERRQPEELREVNPSRALSVPLAKRAASVLGQVAEGQVDWEQARELAEDWLEVTRGEAANAVVDGDEFAVRHLIELCSQILQACADVTPKAEGGK